MRQKTEILVIDKIIAIIGQGEKKMRKESKVRTNRREGEWKECKMRRKQRNNT